jgi:hypothetical protein
MSMGHIFSVGKIEDGVKYAYAKGKLIFCAGGTSTSFTNFVGVIFPASMPETQAITGVKKELPTRNVMFAIPEVRSILLSRWKDFRKYVPVLSYYNGQADYVGDLL